MNAVQKLRQLVGEIGRSPQGAASQAAWDLAGRLLSRMPVDAAAAGRVIEGRDLPGLDDLVRRLEQPEEAPAPPPGSGIPEEDLDRALRAFKKRLRLMRLAEESKLGGRRLTGGRRSEIDAIIPPDEFPPEVWLALGAMGRLKSAGQGFYALPGS